MSNARAGPSVSTLLALTCQQCGGPERFDIDRHSYFCQHCGKAVDPRHTAELARQWQAQHTQWLHGHATSAAREANCSQCGARALLPPDSQTHECSFCRTPLVATSFLASPNFPSAIIAFRIDLARARQIAADWLRANRRVHAAKELTKNLHQMRGSYLPYQLARGPVSLRVGRQSRGQALPGEVMVESKAVCASDRINNDVLDAIEPFDWTELQPFTFGYLGGQSATSQDTSPVEVAGRLEAEITADLERQLSRTLHSSYLNVDVETQQTAQLPALLPVYWLRSGGAELAINGQTGAVGYRELRTRENRSWLIEPAALTVLVFLLAAGWAINAARATTSSLAEAFATAFAGERGQLVGAGSFLAGILFFVVFSDERGVGWRRKVLASVDTRRARRAVGGHGIGELRLHGLIGGQLQPIEIGYYTAGRVLAGLGLLAGWLLAPWAFALVGTALATATGSATLPLFGRSYFTGLIGWWALAVPFAVIGWIRGARQAIFDHPLARPLAGGRWRRLDSADKLNLGELARSLWSMVPLRWVLALILFMLVGTSATMCSAL